MQTNTRHLRTFIQVVESGGYARASARLNLSQPAVSRQVQALEREFGVRLFNRVGRRAELSEDGERLLQQARDLLRSVERFEQRARSIASTGILRVGATPNTIATLLADFLAGYHQRYPGREIRLVEKGGPRLPDSLAREEIDLAVLPTDEPDNVRGHLLYPVHLVAVVAANHPFSVRQHVDVADLRNQPLLRLHANFTLRRWLEPACEEARFQPYNVMESVVPQAIVELARTGFGIAIVPSSVPLSTQGVRVLPILHKGRSIGRWAMVASALNNRVPAGGKRFIDELVAAVRHNFPGRDLLRDAPPIAAPKISRILK